MKNFLVLFFVFFSLSSCVSRLVRPSLTGVIVDFNGNPIQNCTVGSGKTDLNGHFELPEIRKNRFLTELFVMEAPPVFVSENIHRNGYWDKEIQIFDRYGGGAPKGTQWNLDTVYLKETSYDDYAKLLQHSWMVATNKNTLYLLRTNFKELCKTVKCSSVSGKFHQYASDLPRDLIRKSISLTLKGNGQLETVKILQYDNKSSSDPSVNKNDTLRVVGKWMLNANQIELTNGLKELNGTFILDGFDYEYVILTRVQRETTKQIK
jgi:hypothetical protein